MMKNTIVNLNGEILNPQRPEDAKVSIFDRSFLYGDSLYEVLRTYQGRFFGMEEHLSRLAQSAKLCRMRLDQTLGTYQAEMEKTLAVFRAQNPNQEAYCRIIVSRGVGRIGFALKQILTPTQFVVIIQPHLPLTPADFQKGMKLQVSKRVRNDRKALDPALKSGNYLNSLLAYLEAQDAGYEDALLCSHDGFLSEGTTFNFFYVRRGILATPPLEVGILDGITRRRILGLARELGIETREVLFPRERLYEADEVFVSSTLKEALPVLNIDGKQIGTGKPGPITTKIESAFQKHVEKWQKNNH